MAHCLRLTVVMAREAGCAKLIGMLLRLALSCTAFVLACDEGHHAHETPPTGTAANPVQEEMRLVTSALETAVRGVGAGDVRAVEHELHRVHAAKERTGAAIGAGRYRLKRGADRVERFRALDEAFHHELEGLAAASRANDVPAAAAALGEALRACHGCHQEFR